MLSLDEFVRKYNPEFVAKVEAIVKEADRAAKESLIPQLPPTGVVTAPQRRGLYTPAMLAYWDSRSKPLSKTVKKTNGRCCKLCGVHVDAKTRGCSRCSSRHAIRRRAERERNKERGAV